MTDQEILRRAYDMMLSLHQQQSRLEAKVDLALKRQDATDEKVSKLAAKQERYRNKLSSVTDEIEVGKQKRAWWVNYALGIAAALFVSACSAASSYAMARIAPPPAPISAPTK